MYKYTTWAVLTSGNIVKKEMIGGASQLSELLVYNIRTDPVDRREQTL